MRTLLKSLPAFLIAVLLMLAVACENGGDSGDSSSNEPAGNNSSTSNEPNDAGNAEPEAAVLSATEALGRSASDFDEDVQSLQGEMQMQMAMAGMEFGLNGDFAFQSPDQAHMKMAFTGGDDSVFDLSQFGTIEVLVDGDMIYMNMPFLGGWVKGSLSELGVDAAQFEKLLENQSPFDYSALIEGFSGDIQDLGVEEVDGGSYRHYRIDSDFATLMSSLSGALGEDSGVPTDAFSGPIVMDIWLDTETLLPHKVTAEGSFDTGEAITDAVVGDMTFSFTIVINQYNGNVTFPEPPADAKSINELEDSLGGADETPAGNTYE